MSILADDSLQLTAMDGTVLLRNSLPIKKEDPVVSFLALPVEESSFCLLTRSGVILSYKFKLVENREAYQQFLLDKYMKERERKIKTDKLELTQQHAREMRDHLKQRANEESKSFT